MRKSLISLVALSMAATAAPALAQDEAATDDDGFTVSGEAAVVSDYRFRGLSLSDEDPTIQGSITVSHDSGLYVGTWGSGLDDALGFGGTEIDVFAGYSAQLTEAVSFDVGATYYIYPGAEFGDYDYIEFYGSLGTTIGPVEGSVGVAFAPEQEAVVDFFGDEASSVYGWADAGVGVPGTPISLSGHVGYTKSDSALGSGLGNQSFSDHDYWDWSLGASVSYDALTFGVAYVDTDLGDLPGVDAGVVFSLSAGF